MAFRVFDVVIADTQLLVARHDGRLISSMHNSSCDARLLSYRCESLEVIFERP
jgi:hypothetical protein